MQDRISCAKLKTLLSAKLQIISEFTNNFEVCMRSNILDQFGFAKLPTENLLNMENCEFFAIKKQRSLLRHKTAV